MCVCTCTCIFQVQALPLLALELFCTGKMLYMPSPPSEDLLTTFVMDTLPPSMVHVVWPAVALCDVGVLEGLVSKEPTFARVEGGGHWFAEEEVDASVLFGDAEDEKGMSLWINMVVLFVQALGYLQSSQVKGHAERVHVSTCRDQD